MAHGRTSRRRRARIADGRRPRRLLGTWSCCRTLRRPMRRTRRKRICSSCASVSLRPRTLCSASSTTVDAGSGAQSVLGPLGRDRGGPRRLPARALFAHLGLSPSARDERRLGRSRQRVGTRRPWTLGWSRIAANRCAAYGLASGAPRCERRQHARVDDDCPGAPGNFENQPGTCHTDGKAAEGQERREALDPPHHVG